MENQINWPEVIRIMTAGFGAVFAIMILLAVITWLVGQVTQKMEKSKAKEEQAS
jgi:Na+-transporting methylmalonyl-CoA/oxaloacetate decarboxylase gamma subunit